MRMSRVIVFAGRDKRLCRQPSRYNRYLQLALRGMVDKYSSAKLVAEEMMTRWQQASACCSRANVFSTTATTGEFYFTFRVPTDTRQDRWLNLELGGP